MKRKTLGEIRNEIWNGIRNCQDEHKRLRQEDGTTVQKAINVGRMDAYWKVRQLLNGWRDKL